MKKQLGFTLIELMIAVLISSFLIAGIMNLFITTNRTVSLSDALSQNQETGRFSMDYLTRFIRKAGYSQNTTLTPPELMIPNSNANFNFICLPGSIDEQACAANNPGGIKGDRLSIVYVTSALTTTNTCTGRTVGGALGNPGGENSLTDVFWVSNDNELRCRTYNNFNNAWLDLDSVAILNNIESFEFQVGLANTDRSSSAARYVSVDTVIAEGANQRIRSLRIAVLTTSTDDINARKKHTRVKQRIYGVLDAPQNDLTFLDGNLRNLFISTIELPSSIEGAILN
jgi:type IV pilus assembly protein PilW